MVHLPQNGIPLVLTTTAIYSKPRSRKLELGPATSAGAPSALRAPRDWLAPSIASVQPVSSPEIWRDIVVFVGNFGKFQVFRCSNNAQKARVSHVSMSVDSGSVVCLETRGSFGVLHYSKPNANSGNHVRYQGGKCYKRCQL